VPAPNFSKQNFCLSPALFARQNLHERRLAALTPEDENARVRAAAPGSSQKVQNKPNMATGQTKQRCCSF
jgi:hypothetical protein